MLRCTEGSRAAGEQLAVCTLAGIKCNGRRQKPRASRETIAPSVPLEPLAEKQQFGACLGMKIQDQVKPESVPPACGCQGSPCLHPCLPPAPARRRRALERVLPLPRTAMSSLEERETLLTGSCCTQQAAGPLLAARRGWTDRQTGTRMAGWGTAAKAANPPARPKLHCCRHDIWLQ